MTTSHMLLLGMLSTSWILSNIPPQFRFNPLLEGSDKLAIYFAWESQVRSELVDHDWPSKYMEDKEEYA